MTSEHGSHLSPTRRALLAGSVGAAALVVASSAATHASPPSGRAVRWKEGRVFPSFSGSGKIQVADLRDLDGADRLLLITLQGLVNRDRPQVYVILDAVDETWIPSLDPKPTRLSDPFDLLETFRDVVQGAVVYDLDSPHTVNLATTIASLRGAVVASAEQAEEHGLQIIEDLRGRFEDDPSVIHQWAMENLWDECTHEVLVGLPPVHTVTVEDIEWVELLRENEPVHDGSNHDTYTIDLSANLGTGEVYVRLSDGDTTDGWGPAVFGVAVEADGATIASFTPNTPDEEEFLFDGSGTQTKDGIRFADGRNSMIYRFELPEGTARASIDIEMENHFVVAVTDQAPTRVEPFASFRDFALATRALVTWLPPFGDTGAQFEELIDRVDAGTVFAGWFSGDVSGEWAGVELCSRTGVIVVAADHYLNSTVLSAVRANTRAKPSAPTDRTVEAKAYVTLTFGEGDNIQYCQRHMRKLWDDPGRGTAPMNWTVSPLLEDIGPAILHHYQETATENDLLVAGPSGAGYTYPDSWPREELPIYTTLSGAYLERTGMDLVYAFSTQTHGQDPEQLPPDVIQQFAEDAELRGIIQTDNHGEISDPDGPVPLIGGFFPSGGVEAYRTALLEKLSEKQPGEPLFIAGMISAWDWTPTDVAELVNSLPEPFEVVLADEFVDLFRQT